MQIGYKLIAEAFSPKEIVRQGVRAEDVGFDFVEISDHYHPWLTGTPHSGFAWSMLAALAASTDRIALATGVTCPTMRYHPAIVAQAAATTGVLSDGRFTLGLGSGERLNEHVIGGGWPSVSVRQEMLREAIEIIRLLWSGGVSLVCRQAPVTRRRSRVRPSCGAADNGRCRRRRAGRQAGRGGG